MEKYWCLDFKSLEFYSLGALLAKIWGLEFSLFKNLVKKFQIKLKILKNFKCFI